MTDTEYALKTFYKKWFKVKNNSGFLSLKEAFEIGKVKMDIGEVDPVSGSLTGSSESFVDTYHLLAFLHSCVYGNREKLYKPFTVYGGYMNADNEAISRIFTVDNWTNDANALEFKIGHFKAEKSSSGAYTPDTSQLIKKNFIKVTPQDVLEMYLKLDFGLKSFTQGSVDNWRYMFFKSLGGEPS